MNIATFCGHSCVPNGDPVREWLYRVVEEVIREGIVKFYLGGYGEFDLMAASVIRDLKRLHPEVTSILVVSYLSRKVNSDLYDETIFPPLEGVPQRYAIVHRNRWMVQDSDVVIAYVSHDWGGAAGTMKYAKQKRKRILLFPHSVESWFCFCAVI